MILRRGDRRPVLLILLVAVMLTLAGCASKKDNRYRESVDSPPLAIPAGLDTPIYSQAMEIPPARVAQPDEGGDTDIEKPPSLRAPAGDKAPASVEDSAGAQ